MRSAVLQSPLGAIVRAQVPLLVASVCFQTTVAVPLAVIATRGHIPEAGVTSTASSEPQPVLSAKRRARTSGTASWFTGHDCQTARARPLASIATSIAFA